MKVVERSSFCQGVIMLNMHVDHTLFRIVPDR